MIKTNNKNSGKSNINNRSIRNSQKTKEAILLSATTEFSQKGLSGARVDEIAKSAGVNKRMLYHYFGNKDALYLAALERAYEQIRIKEQALNLSNTNPVEGMKILVIFSWQHFVSHPAFISLLNDENLHQARHIKNSQNIRNLNSPLVGMIEDLLARGAKSKEFRSDVDPVQLYITIAAVCYFYLSNAHTLSAVFNRNLHKKSELAARQIHVVELILGYLRPTQE